MRKLPDFRVNVLWRPVWFAFTLFILSRWDWKVPFQGKSVRDHLENSGENAEYLQNLKIFQFFEQLLLWSHHPWVFDHRTIATLIHLGTRIIQLHRHCQLNSLVLWTKFCWKKQQPNAKVTNLTENRTVITIYFCTILFFCRSPSLSR